MLAVRRLILGQLIMTLLLTLAWLVSGPSAAWSSMVGGGIAMIANLCFARRLFAHQGAQAATKILKDFYVGEVMKFIVTLALFWLAFNYAHVIALPLLINYIAAQFLMWFLPMGIRANGTRTS